ncbi:MAG: sigma-70 family RNA polymerase sigma factor [Candidatus Dormibacteria bacterium]
MGDEPDRSGEILADANLAEAVEAARQGDARGWEALFERFHRDVHAYARARLGDWADAEDVTQETFVAAVTSIRSLRDPRRPVVQAWFLHICKHKVIDHVRRRKRAERPVALAVPPPADPAQIAETTLRAEEMRRAMEELSEDQRDVLIRRFVLDQPLDEVAEGTGRTVGAVKSLQHRALAALERRLSAKGMT